MFFTCVDFLFSISRRHTSCAFVTVVQTFVLPVVERQRVGQLPCSRVQFDHVSRLGEDQRFLQFLVGVGGGGAVADRLRGGGRRGDGEHGKGQQGCPRQIGDSHISLPDRKSTRLNSSH